jgi:O-antigen/teichoic acid export membrane protein
MPAESLEVASLTTPSQTDNRLVRNIGLNLVGLLVPSVVALIAVPITARALGPERFGILALASVVLIYLGFLDLGVGRATVRYGAQAIAGADRPAFTRLVSTSLLMHAAFGSIGAILLLALASSSLDRVLAIPAHLLSETRTTVTVVAAAVPISLTMAAARAALEAGQRFDLVNLVSAPTTALTYLLPALGASLGFDLPTIIGVILVSRLGATCAYVALAWRSYRFKFRDIVLEPRLVPALLAFGGWITVSSVVGPVIVYADRFVVTALRGIAAGGQYSAPFDIVTRVSVVPAALATALFPALSSLHATRSESLARVYARSLRYLLLAMGLLVAGVLLSSESLVDILLGPEFLADGPAVLRILAIGTLVNAGAAVALALLHALGRPSIPAKFHLAEILPFLALTWLLVQTSGLPGAAIAWTLRVCIDAALLYVASTRAVPSARIAYSEERVLRTGLLVLGFVTLAWLTAYVSVTGAEYAVIRTVAFVACGLLLLRLALAPEERTLALARLRHYIPRFMREQE